MHTYIHTYIRIIYRSLSCPTATNLRWVLFRNAVALYKHPVLVSHIVRVRQDAPALYYEPAACALDAQRVSSKLN
jgi:hypothetical protein